MEEERYWEALTAKSVHYIWVCCDGVRGSKWTHMGGYVDHHHAQSTNRGISEKDTNQNLTLVQLSLLVTWKEDGRTMREMGDRVTPN